MALNNLQEIFSNREIAIGLWLVIIFVFLKPVREFIKSIIPIVFCKKFVVFYLVFIGYLCIVLYLLKQTGFWSLTQLKDTIFWVMFVEMPLFIKAIQKAKDYHFFTNLMKENIAIIVVIEFILGFWTFNLFAEMIIVPVSVFLGMMFVLAEKERQYLIVKKFINGIYLVFGIIVILNAINSFLLNPTGFWTFDTLQIFLLPLILLLFNLPVVYGLALYSTYEQVFIRLKGSKLEQKKMKLTLFLFSGIALPKITAVRNNLMQTVVISLNNNEFNKNLKRLEEKLFYRVGDNFMKRARFYVISSVLCLFLSVAGIAACNSYVSIKDLLSFNFFWDIQRVKEIITYICSAGVAVSVAFLLVSIGYKKRKYEEISNVKKHALYDLMYLIGKQHNFLQDFIPVDSPKELYIQYISIAYELRTVCDKGIQRYENLLTSWELDAVKQLQTSLHGMVCSIGINSEDFHDYTIENFCDFFNEKKVTAPQNEKINTYLYEVQKSVENYIGQIKFCFNEFKSLIE